MKKPKKKHNRCDKIKALFNAQKGECYLCGGQMTLQLNKPNTAEIEHITPSSVGGLSDNFNRMASGSSCNRFKADKPLYLVYSDLRQMKLCEEKNYD